jgi:hypothetical protein
MYWQYVAEYAQAVTESLQGVYGDDYGLAEAPGFNETALFRIYMNGPSQNSFDFGDCDGDITNSAAGSLMGYGAVPTSSRSLRSLFSYEARRLAKLLGGYSSGGGTKYNCGGAIGEGLGGVDCPRLLMTYSAAGTHQDLLAQPTAKLFKMSAFHWDGRNAVGFFRSAWSAEASGVKGTEAWLGFKAANGVPNHNDLDGGSFVFEVGGQRWASDMGSDDYQLPGYFTQGTNQNQRYIYYRKSTAGHNTLTFNNNGSNWGECDQDPGVSGITEITLFEHIGSANHIGAPTNTPDPRSASASPNADTNANSSSIVTANNSPAYAIVDLTAAYAKQGISRAERGFAFSANYEDFFIVDEIECNKSSVQNVTWSMHTLAKIKLSGASALLSLGGATLHASVLEPKGSSAVLIAEAVELKPPQRSSDGVSKLMLQLTLKPQQPSVAEGSERLLKGSESLPSGSAAVPSMVAKRVTRIIVRLSMHAATAAPTTINPLAQWKSSGPFAGKWD